MKSGGEYLSGQVARYEAGRHSLGQGVSAWLTPNGGWGESNSALIEGHKASLLVDTLWDLPRTAAMLAGFEQTLANAPVTHVVNTHADGDHWFGNNLAGANEIIATKNAARSMLHKGPGEMTKLRAVSKLFRALSRAPVPGRKELRIAADYFDGMLRPFDFAGLRPAYPTMTFSGGLELEVGGRSVQLIEVGPAHTSGDLIVYVPDAHVIVAGDVLFAGTIPLLWDGSSRNWVHACERILDFKTDAILPGHGPPTDQNGVDLVRQYWIFLRGAVKRQCDRGRPAPVAAVNILQSDDYQKQPFARWDGQERIMINVHAIYRRILGKGRHMSVLARLNVLRRTALLARALAGTDL